jgi:hypothetical protein
MTVSPADFALRTNDSMARLIPDVRHVLEEIYLV